MEWVILVLVCGILLLSIWVGSQGMWAQALSVLAVSLLVSLLVSLCLRLSPGDPMDVILGEQASEVSRLELGQALGLLDESGKPVGFVKQYTRFLKDFLSNQMMSFRTREPVVGAILLRLPYTLLLAFLAMCLSLMVSPICGVLSAWFKKRRGWDHFLLFLSMLILCFPRFVLAPLLILIFSIGLKWLPMSGTEEGFLSLVLPVLSLSIGLMAVQFRFVRASMLEVVQEDYIRTARSKGLSEGRIFFKHALRNALIPLITIVGLELGGLMSGALAVEKIFNWPGIGLLLLESIQKKDIPMVQAIVVWISILYATLTFLTDWAYKKANPQVGLQEFL